MSDQDHNYLYTKRLRKEVYQGRIINVGVETVKNAKGEASEFEIIHHPGGAAIVAINDLNQICLLKQFRHAIDEWIWELPAGKLEPNEEPQVTAYRELEEESGYIAKTWHNLGPVYSSPGVFNEILHLFMAKDLSKTQTNIESHEFFEVHWIAMETAYLWALNNTINDAKSIIAIVRAYQLNQLP